MKELKVFFVDDPRQATVNGDYPVLRRFTHLPLSFSECWVGASSPRPF